MVIVNMIIRFKTELMMVHVAGLRNNTFALTPSSVFVIFRIRFGRRHFRIFVKS